MPRKLEFDRDAAIEAAAETFWEKGYGATSLDDLTERLGIGRASLYNAFGDKRALLLEALDAYVSDARQSLNEALASHKSGKAALADVLEGVTNCEGRSAQGCMCVNVGVELHGGDTDIQRAIVANIERMEDTFFSLIKRGQGDGSVRKDLDPRESARTVAALVVGIHSMKRIGVAPTVLKAAARAQLAML
jgi:TetR/AcrR family transcriptional regulator, transcriptional repressor for nem operon